VDQPATYQKAEKVSACQRELDAYAAAIAAYRDCLERQISSAVRQTNDVLDRFRCLSQRDCPPSAGAAPVVAGAEASAAAPLGQGAAAEAAKTPPAEAAPVVAGAEAAAAPAKAAASEPAAAGGGWAVQFAAPSSQADAQNAIARLKSKYAAALGDAGLAVRQAEVKGQTIYRVRADGLSREEASALCAKLKASGGDCFVAKD
jgi:cell division septation protein DedD